MEKRMEDRWLVLFVFFLLAVSMMCLHGCESVRTEYVPVEFHTVDSVFVRDTVVERELIPYKDSVTVSDTASYLCNEYAYSYAMWSGGKLSHSLGIFGGRKFEFVFPSVTRYVRNEVPRPYPVERKLTRWEKVKQDIGGYAIVIVTIMFGSMVYRIIMGG